MNFFTYAWEKWAKKKRVTEHRRFYATINKYPLWIESEGREVVDFNCTCKFSSFYCFSKKFQQRKTICRHILKVIAKLGLTLPKEFRTERNMGLIEKYINE